MSHIRVTCTLKDYAAYNSVPYAIREGFKIFRRTKCLYHATQRGSFEIWQHFWENICRLLLLSTRRQISENAVSTQIPDRIETKWTTKNILWRSNVLFMYNIHVRLIWYVVMYEICHFCWSHYCRVFSFHNIFVGGMSLWVISTAVLLWSGIIEITIHIE